jgi:hypothetical protein
LSAKDIFLSLSVYILSQVCLLQQMSSINPTLTIQPQPPTITQEVNETVSFDILSDAVIKGDLLFTNTYGEDYISALSKSLTKLGVITNIWRGGIRKH